MQFNKIVKSIIEKIMVGNDNVSPKPGRSISTTGRSLGQGTTSADLDGANKPQEIDGELLPSPAKLKKIIRAEKEAKKKLNRKPSVKSFKK